MTEEYISLNRVLKDKGELIDALVEQLSDHPSVTDLAQLKQDIRDREALQSTGVGKGIAIPHAKTVAVNGPVMSLVTLKDGVDYDSFDKQDVKVAFLIAGQKNAASMHIRILSRLSRLLNIDDVCHGLSQIEKPADILTHIKTYETQIWG